MVNVSIQIMAVFIKISSKIYSFNADRTRRIINLINEFISEDRYALEISSPHVPEPL